MMDVLINFFFGLIIIGLPSYIFYRLGMDTGIRRGVRRQLIRDLSVCGIVEKAEPEK